MQAVEARSKRLLFFVVAVLYHYIGKLGVKSDNGGVFRVCVDRDSVMNKNVYD